ncbi:hypothetical protein N9908_03520 [Akkermansiaceae bacterium]|nr:hypothetical protein [Akkermansiaceae bacterium]MDB4416785.1 hypothetical protein [bacterium]MDB0068696.1 hypothetical protein [Akkermansiaceae bacterium]MDB4295294.1 hypothetical protein [Akkermansiaceae bacterium]MDB4578698.1 hypothetical protein [Akkermansiaceae bacterium]
MVESYNKKIATNPLVEMIHLSLDADSEEALAWSKEASMPWPTVLMEDSDPEVFEKPYFEFEPEAPSYILIDANGKELARGKEEAFALIKKYSAAK